MAPSPREMRIPRPAMARGAAGRGAARCWRSPRPGQKRPDREQPQRAPISATVPRRPRRVGERRRLEDLASASSSNAGRAARERAPAARADVGRPPTSPRRGRRRATTPPLSEAFAPREVEDQPRVVLVEAGTGGEQLEATSRRPACGPRRTAHRSGLRPTPATCSARSTTNWTDLHPRLRRSVCAVGDHLRGRENYLCSR